MQEYLKEQITILTKNVHKCCSIGPNGRINVIIFQFLQANGVGNDTEKLNGDHKTIEVTSSSIHNQLICYLLIAFIFFSQEIATSPEKLEKLAAANPPPSTEVVAAE